MSLENLLSALTPSEKLVAMNILWRDLSSEPAALHSPEWHGDVLADRIANPSQGPRLSIDAAFDDIKERLNERRAAGARMSELSNIGSSVLVGTWKRSTKITCFGLP